MRNIELFIEGKRVDLGEASFALNFDSSVFGNITSLKSNYSQTIKLPKTENNNKVFSMAIYPSIYSEAPFKAMECSCYIDGFTMFEKGRCYLVSCEDNEYDITIQWGLFDGYNQWLTAKKNLNELRIVDQDYISWDQNSGVTVKKGGVSMIENPPNGETASMFYKNYDYGVYENTVGKSVCNISPYVSLLEIWERIRRENNLNISISEDIRQDMEKKVIVLTKLKDKSLQNYTQVLQLAGALGGISTNIYDPYNAKTRSLIFRYYGLNDYLFYNRYTFNSYGDGTTSLFLSKINVDVNYESFNNSYPINPSDFRLQIRVNGIGGYDVTPSVSNKTLSFYINRNYTGFRTVELSMLLTRWEGCSDEEWYNVNSPENAYKFFVYGNSAQIYYQINKASYPLAQFRLVPNLPDISQIDFVKFICNLYGLFPVQRLGKIDLMPYTILESNIKNGLFYDWSSKIIDSYTNVPKSLSYTIGNLSRENIMRYADDKVDNVEDYSMLSIKNEMLDRKSDLFVFPFSASKGNRITQYRIKEDGGVESLDCNYRLMQIDGDNIQFSDNLKMSNIVKVNYSPLQNILNDIKVIEEDILLSVNDLVGLDFTKPVYLAKYGRYFIIENIQWHSENKVSRIKLIMIK